MIFVGLRGYGQTASVADVRYLMFRFYATAVVPTLAGERSCARSVRCLQAFTSDLVSRMRSHFHSPCLSSRNAVRDLPYIEISGRSLTAFRDDMSEWRGGFFLIFAEATACGAPAGYYPVDGFRDRITGGLGEMGTGGNPWSSTGGPVDAYYFDFLATWVRPSYLASRAYGLPVRCLQAFTLAIFGRTEHGTRNTENAFCQRVFNLVSRVPFSVFRSPVFQ